MRLTLRFETDHEWHALRRIIERDRTTPIEKGTYNIRMSRGAGDAILRIDVEVTVKDTATGHSMVAREVEVKV